MMTAGRTVVFSATVVALSGSAMVLFPSYFLKSFGCVALISVALTAVTAIVLTPAILVLLGPRLATLDIRRLVRRLSRRPKRRAPADQVFWYRWCKVVIRHAVPLGIAVVVLLILLVSPFAGVRWGLGDDRNLPPTSVSSRQVGDQTRSNFAHNSANDFPGRRSAHRRCRPEQIAAYSVALSRIPDVRAVINQPGPTPERHDDRPCVPHRRGRRREHVPDGQR